MVFVFKYKKVKLSENLLQNNSLFWCFSGGFCFFGGGGEEVKGVF